MTLKWEYRRLLLILPNDFKNASMEISYTTKMLTSKKDEFCIQKNEQKNKEGS